MYCLVFVSVSMSMHLFSGFPSLCCTLVALHSYESLVGLVSALLASSSEHVHICFSIYNAALLFSHIKRGATIEILDSEIPH